MNRLPLSPIKIWAGLKLYRRKPQIAPASEMETSAPQELPSTREQMKMTIVENSADPAARPSSPSIRLNALVTNTTHKIVSTMPNNQDSRAGTNEIRVIPKPLT
jgi:hypothetical protein